MDRYKTVLDQHYVDFTTKLNVAPLVPFLQESDQLGDSDVTKLRKASAAESRQVLFDIVKRKCPDSFLPFYESLAKSGQVELANILLSSDASLPPIESYLRPKKDNRLLNGLEPSATPSNSAINENKNFYHEFESLPSLPETCGVIEDLTVEAVDVAPSMLAFDPSTTYRNFTRPKGLALVINNKKFRGPQALPERIGTDVDARNISNLLEKLDYQVKVKSNLTVPEIRAAMERFAKKKEHEICDSTVVVILTHGHRGGIYGTDNVLLPVDTFVGHLNSIGAPALINKPKIFIIQACRGELYDAGNDSTDGLAFVDRKPVQPIDAITPMDIITSVDQTDALFKKVPLEADILIAYATTPGYVSWRNSAHGSWFIQSICEVFKKNARKEEIQHLFIEVNRMVADRLSTCGHVQVPEPNSRMRKKFYFFPGIYFDPNSV